MAKEKWVDIAGFGGVYQVSDLGCVRRAVGCKGASPGVLRGSARNGYPIVSLRKDGRTISAYVHRLVAAAFLEYEPGGRATIIHHKDGNGGNPAADNLEVLSQRDHLVRHYVESCRDIEPIGPGGGLTMFD